MTASLLLLLAVSLALSGGNGAWITVASVIAAGAAGLRLPDIDAPLGLDHRSALTHCILPLLIALLDRRTWPVAAGLGFGIGFHLAADLFPASMRGYATIKLPLWGSIGVLPSYLWIAANAAANLTGGVLLLDRIATRRTAIVVLVAIAVLGAAYLLRTPGGWYAFVMLAGLGWLILR
ncbi:hypothetical protein [Sphingomonas solaris]|uniref:Uncharacterized protein n=1 Tax=Alterirhizorhabdus solaris TaxID=2529389 RepID=A0A558RAE7_9SPHN|nr:hypothetical protein [Sphingomonas solaris]TVV76344.1 hypothetical protein FOY91_04745 [Sphingomonas solaris]